MINWRFIPYQEHKGSINMAIDCVLFDRVKQGQSPPTVRIYGWKPTCITLGYFQKANLEVNLKVISKMGIDVVNRPTGGRAVLHVNELTYSVIAPITQQDWCKSKASSYDFISQALTQALSIFGVTPNLDKSYPIEAKKNILAMNPCFSSSAKSEIMWETKKIVGSAQKRDQWAFIQHGSILCSLKYLEIVNYLKLNEVQKPNYLETLKAKSISLEQILNQPIAPQEISTDFLNRFTNALNIKGELGDLTEEEWLVINRL